MINPRWARIPELWMHAVVDAMHVGGTRLKFQVSGRSTRYRLD